MLSDIRENVTWSLLAFSLTTTGCSIFNQYRYSKEFAESVEGQNRCLGIAAAAAGAAVGASDDPFLHASDEDLRFFKFEDSNINSRLLRHSEAHPTYDSLELPTDQSDHNYPRWEQWIQSEALQETTRGEPRDVTDQSGYHVLLCARVLPFQVKPLMPNPLQYLPIRKDIWKGIVQRLRPPGAIIKALRMKRCYTICLASNTGTEPVELFTAAIPPRGTASPIAISSTHFIKSRLTLATIYGCSEKQMDRVDALLRMSPEVRSHPFLMAGLFAELQRDRMELLVQEMENELDCIMVHELQFHRSDVWKEKRGVLYWDSSRRISHFRNKAKQLEDEIQTLKGELEKLTSYMETPLDGDNIEGDPIPQAPTQSHRGGPARTQPARPPVSSDKQTKRFVDRLGEICRDLDPLIGRCRYAVDELTFAREVVRDELASREAHDTGQQTRSSMVVGFVAMLYLPITAMATIFATPVFDFHNDWRDIGNRPFPTPDDNDASGQRDLPVVSVYFWYYFSLSVFFTIITVLIWRWKTQRNKTSGLSLVTASPA
ncbi:hypothetical protein B0T16DRAFT_460396 [Cercophora newfieldiana]|uniref:Uncharacterized protein n=1 Tax=Cercophora newfieldiana TaxID=92897 RepID=A0AA40CPA2_9PEZI|nr:hypothetical protein B0T16DRAFT_460396 [Cercophora newfieldiana]